MRDVLLRLASFSIAPDGEAPERSIVQRFRDHATALDYGATAGGQKGDSAAINRAVQKAGRAILPPGRYLLDEPLEIGAGILQGAGRAQTQLIAACPGIAISLKGGAAHDFTLMPARSAREDPASMIGEVGIHVERSHKPSLQRLHVEGFRLAGIVLDGPQNMLVQDVFCQLNLLNYWFCNQARTITLSNCNASDANKRIDARSDTFAPHARSILIGQYEQRLIPQDDPTANRGIDTPSNILVTNRGIFERFQQHETNVEIRQAWGRVTFDHTEFCDGAKSLLKIHEGVRAKIALLRPDFISNWRGRPETIIDAPPGLDIEIVRPLFQGAVDAKAVLYRG